MIHTTLDYSIFKKHHLNRDIDEGNLDKIINSLRHSNLLNIQPILINEKYEVIDGQHRLEACKILNIPVSYRVLSDTNSGDIATLQINKKWTWDDYIKFYAKLDKPDALKVVELCNLLSVRTSTIMRMIIGGNRSNKEGVFKLTGKIEGGENTYNSLVEVAPFYNECIRIIENESCDFLKSSTVFREALLSFLMNLCPSRNLFMKKLPNKIHFLKRGMSRKHYTQALIDIYNFSLQKERIPNIL